MNIRRIAVPLVSMIPLLVACGSGANDSGDDGDPSCGNCGGVSRGNAGSVSGGAGAMPIPGTAGFPAKGSAGTGGSAGAPSKAAGSAGAAGKAGAAQGMAGSTQGKAGAAQGTAGSSQSAGATQGTAGSSQSAGATQGTAGSSQSAGATQGAAGASQGSGGTAAATDARVIGYFAAWAVYGRDYHVMDIPAAKLTHVNYAFANVSGGECVLGDPYADTDKAYPGDTWDTGAKRGSFHQLALLKAKHPHLRAMISVGGWTWSGTFSDVALTDASRKKFAASCVAFIETWGFDGVDIDWEYPVTGGLDSNQRRPEDGHNYTLLLAELRAQLDAKGKQLSKKLELSIAAPTGPSIYAHMELAELSKSTDYINLMSYDFNGSWSDHTAFNAPLYATPDDPSNQSLNTDAAVQAFVKAGVPRDKVVVGVPFYGRGWSGVGAKNGGLFQAFTGMPQGTWEAGIFDWKDLKANYVPKYTRSFHDAAKVPWLFDAAKGVMISYDDPQSIQIKADYIKKEKLGGAMIWEMSGDDDESSLLAALTSVLRP